MVVVVMEGAPEDFPIGFALAARCGVAQSVEQGAVNSTVIGSSPIPTADIADQIAAMQPELMRAALHWTDGRRSDAEDLMQDTMLRALRYRHKFQLGTNLKAWLLTIMRHVFYDKGQREKPTESLDKLLSSDDEMAGMTLGGALEAFDDTEATAVAAVTIDETMDSITEDMPPYYEKVVRLVFMEGCTYQEAAEELGIPLGTAMSAVFRARRRLGLRGQKLDEDLRAVA